MPDEIARFSEALARDPSGMGWVPLADALRRTRRLAAAERTAIRGLERHPYHADGHDVLARIAADGGDLGRARDEWEMALRLDPRHVGARLGLGWLSWRSGDRASAERWWQGAHELAPSDPRVQAAGRQLQRAASPRSAADGAVTSAATGPQGARPTAITAFEAPPTEGGAATPAATPGAAPVAAPAEAAIAPHAAASIATAPSRPGPRPVTPVSDAGDVPAAPVAAVARAAAPRRGGGDPAGTASQAAHEASAVAPLLEESGDAHSVFAPVVRGGATFALLVDADGLVLAGSASVAPGEDRADVLAAELSGLCSDAQGALRQLHLGEWEHVLVEGESATLALAPSAAETTTLVATPAGTPAGLPRLLLDRARQRASQWMESL